MRLIAITVSVVVVLIATFMIANRPVHVTVQAAIPEDFPADGFSHRLFEELLDRWVDEDGYVDYDGWHMDSIAMADLDSYLAAVSAYSPGATPDRFPNRQDQLAYWMYGYNAWVIRSVLNRWPLASVTDVKAPIEAVRGLGFFYQLRFSFGGESLSLLTVENERIRKGFRDPRIHFVLNCGSESCPVIRPELPTGDALEALLERAAHDFVNDEKHVFVDHDRKTIFLSAIFKWYEDDYLNWLRATGRPAGRGLIDYVREYSDAGLLDALTAADAYPIAFRDFDWTINATEAAKSKTTH